MKLNVKSLKVLLVLLLVGFGVGIYLQDLEHRKSTAHAWKANRYNLSKFNKITEYNKRMSSKNWRVMQDSISRQLDTLMILRYRREVDSIKIVNATRNASNQKEGMLSDNSLTSEKK